MCCCHTDWSHNEAQKFQILGNEDDLREPIAGLSKRMEGEVRTKEPLDEKLLPKWLWKESNRLQDRNLFINDVVEFLMSGDKRLLTLYGDPMNGRSSILEKAIKIVISHRPEIYIKKPIYQVHMIDMGGKPRSQICSEIVKVLNL